MVSAGNPIPTWSSRVILVTKRDGSRRFCVDFRELNKVTRADSYTKPHPKDIMDRMYGDTRYSFLDGASAYWSVEIDEGDKYKTAFATTRGLYEFNRMPFGLINSGSTYQRLVDEVLREVQQDDPYGDDVCVHSKGFNSHMEDLKKTLEALRKARVKVRLDKCTFGDYEGEYLGHIVSKEGRHQSPKLMEKILEASVPKPRKSY